MTSPAYEAYQAILTAADPALATLVRARDDMPDLFSLVADRDVAVRPALVFDDRSRFPGTSRVRRWRPTVAVTAPQGFAQTGAGDGDVVVVVDGGFPATLQAQPSDLVIIGPGPHSDGCHQAGNLIRLVGQFAQAHAQLAEKGAGVAQIIEHPRMREMAGIIHSLSIQFGATFREGIVVNVGSLMPPAGARQLAPALWLQRNAGLTHADPALPAQPAPQSRRPAFEGPGV